MFHQRACAVGGLAAALAGTWGFFALPAKVSAGDDEGGEVPVGDDEGDDGLVGDDEGETSANGRTPKPNTLALKKGQKVLARCKRKQYFESTTVESFDAESGRVATAMGTYSRKEDVVQRVLEPTAETFNEL